jgi:glycosyltransferase involved in cell wall biosynthesis
MAASLGVLITYFNERELLRECLESLGSGKDRPDEILIYDDASEYPAQAYVPQGWPVKIIRGNVNKGPSVGRNTLMKKSHSDYIHFHDADDLFDPSWTRRLREAIAQRNPDAVFTEISSFHANGRRSEKILALDRLTKGGDLLRFCLQGPLLAPSGTYRRDVVLSIGGYKESRWQSEDFDFHVRLARRGIRFEAIREPLINIRIRADGRSQNSREVWTSTLAALQEFSHELPAEYHADLAEAAATTGSMLYRAGDRRGAAAAFQLAERLGPPNYGRQWGPYRWIARTCGPATAEKALELYRGCFPASLRPWLRGALSRHGGQTTRDSFF